MKTTLGHRVREARKARGLSRKLVAIGAGMAYSTLADIENDASFTCTRIAQLARTLGVNSLWLETESGPMQADIMTATRIHQAVSVASQPCTLDAIIAALKVMPALELAQVKAVADHLYQPTSQAPPNTTPKAKRPRKSA